MRKSFDGLAEIVRDQLGDDPLSGHLLLFASKRRDRVKLLYFEKGGFAIWYKRLETGTFAIPQLASDGKSVQLSAEDLAHAKRRPRYEKPIA